MLTDTEMFEKIENMLTDSGKLHSFFKSTDDKLMGRMMITCGQVPEELKITVPQNATVFIGSFDFYDSTVGTAIDTKTKKTFGGIWITPQVENADVPTDEWIEFFVAKLLESINDDGTYGIPVCSFIGSSHDMTVVPSRQ